jgi:nucleoside phosphorylase
MNQHYELQRLSAPKARFEPVIHTTPDLPRIDWKQVGQTAPKLLDTPADKLPQADSVVITWAAAEWAAMQHVFCSSESSMPYADRTKGSWSGWEKDSNDLPAGHPSDWTFWSEYRLVEVGEQRILLFKSNTHLDWPGQTFLEGLIKRLISEVRPKLILSIGTAGGAKVHDHVGTVRIVSAGTLYEKDQQPSQWPTYENSWKAPWSIPAMPGFSKLLFPIPTTSSDIQGICDQYNKFYSSNYSLAQLDPNTLSMGQPMPEVANQTGGEASLLTTPIFLVGTTDGKYEKFACVEMDDAVIGKVCAAEHTAFGFVRNLSNPVQNVALPGSVQAGWGGAIYSAYGLYTSYNGALATWAALAGHTAARAAGAGH